MNDRNVIRWPHRSSIAGSIFIAFFTTLAADAGATCFPTAKGAALKLAPLSAKAPFAASAAASIGARQEQADASLVGLWKTQFLLGEGPDLFDESFQQFHSDGTEMMLSRGLPPSLGNVCVGVWKQTAPRAFTLRHLAWNWDADGRFISIFVMEVRLRLDRHGNAYVGTWSSDNLSPTTGEPLPGEHFEGRVRGTRITVH